MIISYSFKITNPIAFDKIFKDYVVKTYSQTACAAINTTIDKIHQLRLQLDFKKFNTL